MKSLLLALFLPATAAFAGLVTVYSGPRKFIPDPIKVLQAEVSNLEKRLDNMQSQPPISPANTYITQDSRIVIQEEHVNFTLQERRQLLQAYIHHEEMPAAYPQQISLAPSIESENLKQYSPLYSYMEIPQ